MTKKQQFKVHCKPINKQELDRKDRALKS